MPLAETVLRIAAFAAGIVIIYRTFRSAVQTIILPRAARTMLTSFVFRTLGRLFLLRARRHTTYRAKDRVFALYAPVTLLSLVAAWLLLILLAYALVYWALGVGSVLDAIRLSGSSLFTLGFSMDPRAETLIFEFSEAAIGVVLVAMLMGYLPTLYAVFSQRETMVNLLEVRAGSPPSAVGMIIRIHSVRGLGHIVTMWESWEPWFAQLEETHTTFSALVFFRSPQPERSWVTAAGTILDAASLINAVVDMPPNPQSRLVIRAGFLALRRIADSLGIPHNPDPRPDDPISISRAEWDAAVAEMEAAGVPLKEDRDQAWRDYAGWRVNYDRVLLALAALTSAPYAQWVSDRSLPGYRLPRLRRTSANARDATS
jgi:ABC-type multidrug transport system fused ATPase/permease subunit